MPLTRPSGRRVFGVGGFELIGILRRPYCCVESRVGVHASFLILRGGLFEPASSRPQPVAHSLRPFVLPSRSVAAG